jgi:hypothetical protein
LTRRRGPLMVSRRSHGNDAAKATSRRVATASRSPGPTVNRGEAPLSNDSGKGSRTSPEYANERRNRFVETTLSMLSIGKRGRRAERRSKSPAQRGRSPAASTAQLSVVQVVAVSDASRHSPSTNPAALSRNSSAPRSSGAIAPTYRGPSPRQSPTPRDRSASEQAPPRPLRVRSSSPLFRPSLPEDLRQSTAAAAAMAEQAESERKAKAALDAARRAPAVAGGVRRSERTVLRQPSLTALVASPSESSSHYRLPSESRRTQTPPASAPRSAQLSRQGTHGDAPVVPSPRRTPRVGHHKTLQRGESGTNGATLVETVGRLARKREVTSAT